PAAAALGVVRIVVPQARDRLLDDRRRRIEVRIADAEHDDVLTRRLRRARAPVQGPRIGAVVLDPRGEWRDPQRHAKSAAAISSTTTWRRLPNSLSAASSPAASAMRR